MPLPATALHATQQRAANPNFPNHSEHPGLVTLIFRLRDRRTKAKLKEHALLLMPTRFRIYTEPRTAIYYGKKGPLIDTPQGDATGLTYFQIAGHTGFRGIPQSRGASSLLGDLGLGGILGDVVSTAQHALAPYLQGPSGGSLVDGAAAIKDLADMVQAYYNPLDQFETISAVNSEDLLFEFANLSAPTSASDLVGRVGWEIHPYPNMVQIEQDAQHPFLYNYTLTFVGWPLAVEVTDLFTQVFSNPVSAFRQGMNQLNRIVQDVTNGVNTLSFAFDQLVMTNVTGPIGTLLNNCGQLSNAVAGFVSGLASKIAYPLYVQRTVSHLLDAPQYSVSTLRFAAQQLSTMLADNSSATATSGLAAGTTTTSGTNDVLSLALNYDQILQVSLGTHTSGAAIAAALQDAVRTATPTHTSNVSAYRDFTATYADGQYVLRSGTVCSDGAAVTVVVPADPTLAPTDASTILKLGIPNGGLERPGTALALPALALLRDVEAACTRLLAFPEAFAAQLEEQDAAAAAFIPVDVPHRRSQLTGPQYMQSVRVLPGDSLQAIAARAGVPWETLALTNQLTYPYLLLAPTTLLEGRATSGDRFGLTDSSQGWAINGYQGMRLDLLAGTGNGQSRMVLMNTATHLSVDRAWDVPPNDLTTYAVRSANNPILQTSILTACDARTLTDSSLHLVPDMQRGLTLVIGDGPAAGVQRRIVEHDETSYLLDPAFDALPPVGTTYLILVPRRGPMTQRLLGDMLSVPRSASREGITGQHASLEDVSTITGRTVSLDEKLFGRDWLLQGGNLLWDPAREDCVSLAGLPNLRQAVVHLVNVPLGEIEYNPGLGSYVREELGNVATLPSQRQLLASVQRTLKQDPRIAQMTGAQLFTHGGRSYLSIGATAINGASVERVVIR